MASIHYEHRLFGIEIPIINLRRSSDMSYIYSGVSYTRKAVFILVNRGSGALSITYWTCYDLYIHSISAIRGLVLDGAPIISMVFKTKWHISTELVQLKMYQYSTSVFISKSTQ